MNKTFKTKFPKREWTINENKIFYKRKEISLSSLIKVEHSVPQTPSSNGVIQVFWGDGLFDFATLTYSYNEKEEGNDVYKYILDYVNAEKSNPSKPKEDYKQNSKLQPTWFIFICPLLFGVLGFIIMDEKIIGKILGALLFIGIGIVIAFVTYILIRLLSTSISKKEKTRDIIETILCIVICILIALFAVTREYGKYQEPKRKYYDKHGKVHYSEEDRDEANFVYDMYGAAYDN